VNRRLTGGGAIYFDESSLGWEIIASKDSIPTSRGIEELFRLMCEGPVRALSMLGIVVRDDWQNQGLGTALMEAILDFASRAGVERMVGIIGLSNDRMIHVCNKLGFATSNSCYDTVKMARALPRRV